MYIILNPPFGKVGNRVLQNIIENEKIISLDPLSDLRVGEIYKKVQFVKGPFSFDNVNSEMYITFIKENIERNINYKEFFIKNTVDKKLLPFYKENLKRKPSFIYHCWETEETWKKLYDENRTFLLTGRTCIDGVHRNGRSLDEYFNLKHICEFSKKRKEGAFCMYNKKTNLYGAQGYEFKTIKEKENIIHWWYNSNLADILSKGLHKQGFARGYIPRIDWAKDIEYTDEIILKEMGLKKIL